METLYMLRATLIEVYEDTEDEGEMRYTSENLWFRREPRPGARTVLFEQLERHVERAAEAWFHSKRWEAYGRYLRAVVEATSRAMFPFYLREVEVLEIMQTLREHSCHEWQDFTPFIVHYEAFLPLFRTEAGHQALMLPPDMMSGAGWTPHRHEDWSDDYRLAHPSSDWSAHGINPALTIQRLLEPCQIREAPELAFRIVSGPLKH